MSHSPHEIEIKWMANRVSRSKFNRFIWSVIDKVPHSGWSFKTTGGPDHYFANSLGFVARHRDGVDCKELTVKARVDDEDITVRVEHNIPLDLKLATTQVVHSYLKTSGYRKQVTIVKDCDIYDFKMKNSPTKATVVWYEVSCKGRENQTFIEVEVDGGTKKQRMKALNLWAKIIKKNLKLKDKDISKSSLYEIYTPNRYLMAG